MFPNTCTAISAKFANPLVPRCAHSCSVHVFRPWNELFSKRSGSERILRFVRISHSCISFSRGRCDPSFPKIRFLFKTITGYVRARLRFARDKLLRETRWKVYAFRCERVFLSEPRLELHSLVHYSCARESRFINAVYTANFPRNNYNAIPSSEICSATAGESISLSALCTWNAFASISGPVRAYKATAAGKNTNAPNA